MASSRPGSRNGDARSTHSASSHGVQVEGGGVGDNGQLRPARPAVLREPSIRLRRALGASQFAAAAAASRDDTQLKTTLTAPSAMPSTSGRRRSSSEPQPMVLQPAGQPIAAPMPVLREEHSGPSPIPTAPEIEVVAPDELSLVGTVPAEFDNQDLDANMIDVLDVVDPEVSTLTTLTNVQNSLFVPDIGPFLSRRPLYTLTPAPTRAPVQVRPPSSQNPEAEIEMEAEKTDLADARAELTRSSTITSTMSESRYAVLPHGRDLHGWTAGEKEELNDHVRHMLHSRRSAIQRGWSGFLQYAKTPLGFFVTVYATLITLFGLAWVLFLIGWINVGNRKLYIINVIDNILVALFAIIGDGLAPFRAWDTYNMVYIAYYHRLTWKLRKKKALSKLANKNDLPTQREEEVGMGTDNFVVLTEKQQASLELHEARFCRSHTFYKPHETTTHFAFPVRLLIVIVILLDCHSLLQISLGACTWGISYHTRPFALTTVILCCSITCNITAGVLISVGDHKTRKKDVLERMFRQELTGTAIAKIEKRRKKEEKRNQELDQVPEHEHEHTEQIETKPPSEALTTSTFPEKSSTEPVPDGKRNLAPKSEAKLDDSPGLVNPTEASAKT